MSQINLEAGTRLSTAVLIADLVATTNGSDDSTAQLTQVNGETASIAFEIQSVLGAALLPRVSTAVMNAFTATNGMIIYNTTAQAFYGYINGAWAAIAYIGTDIGLTAGLNIVLTPNPIISSGTVALSTTLTSLISVQVGNITLSSSTIKSTGSLVFQTNGTTTALTLDTSQNAVFDGTVTISELTLGTNIIDSSAALILQTDDGITALTLDLSQNATFAENVNLLNSNTLNLGSNATGATAFDPAINLYGSTTDHLNISMVNSGTAAQIEAFNVGLYLYGLGIFLQDAVTCASTLALGSSGGGSIIQQAPNIAGNFTYTWPTGYPSSNGYILASSTAGVLSWIINEETTGTANTLAYFNSSGVLASQTNVTVATVGNIILNENGSSGNSVNLQFNNGTTTTVISNNSGAFIIDANGTEFIVQTASNVTALTIDTSQNATFVGSVKVGNITLSTNNINASGALVLATNGSTAAISISTAQVSTFGGNIILPQSGSSGNSFSIRLDDGTNAAVMEYNAGTLLQISPGSIQLQTNSITALTLDTSQNATVAGVLTATGGIISNNNINITSPFSFVSTAAMTFKTNSSVSSTLALTLDTLQNATFVGSVRINSNNGLALNNSANTFSTTLLAGGITSSLTYTLPTAYPASNGYILSSTTAGVMSWVTNEETTGTANTLAYFNSGGVLASQTNVTVQTGGNIVLNESGSSGNSVNLQFADGTNTTVMGYNAGVFLVISAGSIQLAPNSITALTLDTSQNATVAGVLTATGGIISNNNINITSPFSFVSTAAMTFKTNSSVSSTLALTLDTLQNATFVGSVRINSNNGLVLNNSANTFATSLNAGSSTATYTITYPPTGPSNAGFMNTTSSGGSNWVTGRCLFSQTSGAQTIPSGSSTLVQFSTTDYNNGGVITASGSGNTTFTNTSGSTIYVQVIYNVLMTSIPLSNPNPLQSFILINGGSTGYGWFYTYGGNPISTEVLSLNGNTILMLNNNDHFTVTISQGTGSTITVGNAILNIWQLA